MVFYNVTKCSLEIGTNVLKENICTLLSSSIPRLIRRWKPQFYLKYCYLSTKGADSKDCRISVQRRKKLLPHILLLALSFRSAWSEIRTRIYYWFGSDRVQWRVVVYTVTNLCFS